MFNDTQDNRTVEQCVCEREGRGERGKTEQKKSKEKAKAIDKIMNHHHLPLHHTQLALFIDTAAYDHSTEGVKKNTRLP